MTASASVNPALDQRVGADRVDGLLIGAVDVHEPLAQFRVCEANGFAASSRSCCRAWATAASGGSSSPVACRAASKAASGSVAVTRPETSSRSEMPSESDSIV